MNKNTLLNVSTPKVLFSIYTKAGQSLGPVWFWITAVATGLTATLAVYDLVSGRYSLAAYGFFSATASLCCTAITGYCLWLSGRKPTPEPKRHTEVK